MNDNQIEWKKWEESQCVFTMEKVFGIQRSPVDPKREKQYEYDKKRKDSISSLQKKIGFINYRSKDDSEPNREWNKLKTSGIFQ